MAQSYFIHCTIDDNVQAGVEEDCKERVWLWLKQKKKTAPPRVSFLEHDRNPVRNLSSTTSHHHPPFPDLLNAKLEEQRIVLLFSYY